MSSIRSDRRSLQAEARPESDRFLREGRRAHAEHLLRYAHHFAEIADSGHFRLESCASVGEYGWRLGYGRTETLNLVALGRGVRACPSLRERFLAGKIALTAAAEVSRVLCDAELLGPDPEGRVAEAWLDRAKTESLRDLRRAVRRRIEVVRQQLPDLRSVTLHVAPDALDGFRRCRTIAMRRAGTVLTEGQVFRILVRSYRKRYDPKEQPPSERRRPAQRVARSRHVPAAVARAVRARAGDRCEVPGCTHDVFLEFMHLGVPFAEGGKQEVDTLALACTGHHTLYDAGVIRVAGWSPDGRPVFATARGALMDEPAQPRAGTDPPGRTTGGRTSKKVRPPGTRRPRNGRSRRRGTRSGSRGRGSGSP